MFNCALYYNNWKSCKKRTTIHLCAIEWSLKASGQISCWQLLHDAAHLRYRVPAQRPQGELICLLMICAFQRANKNKRSVLSWVYCWLAGWLMSAEEREEEEEVDRAIIITTTFPLLLSLLLLDKLIIISDNRHKAINLVGGGNQEESELAKEIMGLSRRRGGGGLEGEWSEEVIANCITFALNGHKECWLAL